MVATINHFMDARYSALDVKGLNRFFLNFLPANENGTKRNGVS